MELANVHEFKGEYRFLSNFWVEKDGSSVEHKFQAAKTHDQVQATWVLDAPTPGEAKRRGRRVVLRQDWEKVKFQIMSDLVEAKFRNDPELAARLVATGNAQLFEGNNWNDTYWGVDLRTGRGVNALGKILMFVRSELQ